MFLDISKKFTANSARVKCVDIHPTEPWIASSLYNGVVFIYNYRAQTPFRQIDVTDCPIRAIKFVARKQWIVSASDDMFIRVHNIDTSQCIAKWEAHLQYIRCLAIHPTQPIILSGSDDNTIKLWNWKRKFSLIRTFEGHSHYVMCLVFNPKDPNLFASASLDRTIKTWNIGSSTPNFSLEGHEDGINCVDYYWGGDKPYLVSGADDCLVKVWDYQTKTCVQTLEGHTNNVTSVAFHPKLFLIFSGSEDGTFRIWNSNTFRAETTLNYDWDRIWSVCCSKGKNALALGFDKGTILLKFAKELPSISMDATGKVIYAKHNNLYGCNLQQALASSVEDGAPLEVSVKELGTCDFYPHYIKHSYNGHLVAVFDDKEYIIYTALQVRSKSFGTANEFVWNKAGGFAIRQDSSVTIYTKNFEVSGTFKPDYYGDCLFSGSLLGIRGNAFVCMYDWTTCRLVSRIDVVPRQIVWNEVGDHLVILTAKNFYILRCRAEGIQALYDAPDRTPEDSNPESVFEVLVEMSEVARSALWVGDCLIYINNQNILRHCVGKRVDSIAYLDNAMYLLGYLPRFGRIVLSDKNQNMVTYALSLSVINFQTAMLRGDIDGAKKLALSVPESEHFRVAQFLESCGHPEWALEQTNDEDHKFSLALRLRRLDLAREIALKSDSGQKWQEMSRVALQAFRFDLAEEFMWLGKDFSFLLTLFCAFGDINKLEKLAEEAKKEEQMNVACICYALLGKMDEFIAVLASTGKIAEAALMARSYAPSQIPKILSLWRADLSPTYPTQASCLADPEQYPNLFPEFEIGLENEEKLRAISKQVDEFSSGSVHLTTNGLSIEPASNESDATSSMASVASNDDALAKEDSPSADAATDCLFETAQSDSAGLVEEEGQSHHTLKKSLFTPSSAPIEALQDIIRSPDHISDDLDLSSNTESTYSLETDDQVLPEALSDREEESDADGASIEDIR